LLEGKNVNLRLEEKEDMKLVSEWMNNPDYWGEYNPLWQRSRTELEKKHDTKPPEVGWFIIEKKDESKIGSIGHSPAGRLLEIGYAISCQDNG
jgi:RimJ/RimL family protein N-acetyltransferase